MAVIISNQQEKVPVSEETTQLVERLVAEALAAEEAPAEAEVSLTLVDDEAIRGLNREWRALDEPTDVLSFSLLEGGDGEPEVVGGPDEIWLGDIVISLERALAQAAEYGHSWQRELGFLVVHGIMHLLGYDHLTPADAEVMRQKEEAILGALGLTR
ncbi:MAG: rRNA maturation RNase YbeY [Bacillota bacterium]